MEKSAISFHRTFALSRTRLAEVVSVVGRHEGAKNLTELVYQQTNLGTIQAEAFNRYAQRSGIIDSANRFTEFGRKLFSEDRHLSSTTSQWLIHYHLSAPHGPGVGFWSHLVLEFLSTSREFRAEDLETALRHFLHREGLHPASDGTLRSACTVFRGTYEKAEGLGALAILSPNVSNGPTYCVGPAIRVPTWVFAYALADFWDHYWSGQVTLSLHELMVFRGLASMFFLEKRAVDEIVTRLISANVIELYKTVQPYQIVRKWGTDWRSTFLGNAYDGAAF